MIYIKKDLKKYIPEIASKNKLKMMNKAKRTSKDLSTTEKLMKVVIKKSTLK